MKRKDKQKRMEEYYTEIYANRRFNIAPEYLDTIVHPDCLFKNKDEIIAVEATGYFYQQETDYSNRIYNKVSKFMRHKRYIKTIYERIGRAPLHNIIDAIYYDHYIDLVNDIKKEKNIIEEIKYNNNYYYNKDTLDYNIFFDGTYYKGDIDFFFNLINPKDNNFKFLVTLVKHYTVPIKIVLIHDKNFINNRKKTLVPVVSFKVNTGYSFKSLRSLILNKEEKLLHIYRSDLKKRCVKYDKFVLLVHPIDYPCEVDPKEIYEKLKDLFMDTKYDEIAIILKDNILVGNNKGYKLY